MNVATLRNLTPVPGPWAVDVPRLPAAVDGPWTAASRLTTARPQGPRTTLRVAHSRLDYSRGIGIDATGVPPGASSPHDHRPDNND